MSCNADPPVLRYNTEITRDYFEKYREPSTGQSFFSRFSLWKGNDSDLLEKTMFGATYGTFAGVIGAFHTNVKHKGQFTILSVAEKSFKHGMPWVIAGSTYGVAVGLLTQIRHKEDAINHMLAGYAAGTMLGAWYKWPKMGIWSGIVMGLAGGMLKQWQLDTNWEHKPLKRQRLFNMYRRGWFTERPEAEGKDDAEMDVSFRAYR